MILSAMRNDVAENLGILAAGPVVINGVVTSTGIDNHLNQIYREELFPIYSNAFPDDFKRTSYPYPTYTATGVVDVTSSGTTLVATTAIFNNSMEGFEIQNGTTNEKFKIETYLTTSSVTLSEDVPAAWIGATVYVLGNEYSFGGDMADIQDIMSAHIKYQDSDTYFKVCGERNKTDVLEMGNETYNTAAPMFYPTTITVSGVAKRGIGFLPAPTDYTGKWFVEYVQKPPVLTASDEPIMTNSGASQVMVFGTTAWGFRLQKRWEDATYYQNLYEQYKRETLRYYRPTNRGKATQVRQSSYGQALARRRI